MLRSNLKTVGYRRLQANGPPGTALAVIFPWKIHKTQNKKGEKK
jgi:hypothetical protein